jgi:Tfp pilus assembly protein PilE
MSGRRTTSSRGVALVEVVVAGVVITVAAICVLSYEYHAVAQTRIAKAQAAAVQVGYFLLQDWKANGGSSYYRLTGPAATDEPVVDASGQLTFVEPGVFKLTVDNIPLRVELTRPNEYLPLIPITVRVRWRMDFVDAPLRPFDPSLVLTTYARADQSGG